MTSRPRVTRLRVASLLTRAIICLLLAYSPAHAQSGALFLLVPFGARAVGLGDAVSADTTLGAEGVWWNAASLARMASKEIAFHHSQTFLANSEMLTVIVPSRVIGTIGLAGYFVDYGDVQATDDFGSPTGVISNRTYLLSASYATPVGRRASLGLTYKFFLLRFNDCSGSCGLTSVGSGSSSAVDIGAQYVVPTTIPLAVGLSVRNLGPRLQVKDQPQADPLPRVLQGGVSARVPIEALTRSEAAIDVNADFAQSQALGGAILGVGASLSYRSEYFLRAGFKHLRGDGGGPSLGLGFQRGAFGFDFSRRFDRLSSQLGETPTYITLRATF